MQKFICSVIIGRDSYGHLNFGVRMYVYMPMKLPIIAPIETGSTTVDFFPFRNMFKVLEAICFICTKINHQKRRRYLCFFLTRHAQCRRQIERYNMEI